MIGKYDPQVKSVGEYQNRALSPEHGNAIGVRVGGLSVCISMSNQLREATELLSQVVGDKLGGLMTVQPGPRETKETVREEMAPIPEELFIQMRRSLENVQMVIELIRAMDV